MKKIRFAIIGCGRIAERHAEHIAARGELIAVCDIDRQKADNLAKKYQARVYDSPDKLFSASDIDVLAVCTPNGLHAEHTIRGHEAGFHVVCEKPMALDVADCKKMIDAAEKANRRLFIVKQNRFNPPVMAVKAVVDEGKLGKLYSMQLNCFWNRTRKYYDDSPWKGTKKLDGGTLYTQFSHFIDLLCWLAGDVKSVKALFSNYANKGVIEFEDTGVVILEFQSGVMASIHYTVNSYEKNMEGSLTLFGEKGTVKIGGQYLNELEYQNIEGYTIGKLPAGNRANDYGHYQGSMSNHDKVYDNVMDVLQHNAAISTSSSEGMKTVEVIQKIYSEGVSL